MLKLSSVILAKDEENMIADCIASLSFSDEIVLIDGGSKDRTVEIAKKMGATVIIEPFSDFATARNFGLHHARGEWILYVDADERVGEELRESIEKELVKDDKTIGAYIVKRKNFYLGNHEWPHIEKMERLFRKEYLKKWYGVLHETPEFEGKKETLKGFLLHYTHRDLSSMVSKTVIWSTTEAKLRFEAHHPKIVWWRFPRVMISAFWQSYITQKGYRVGLVGLIESIYQAFSIFITYAKLWEMQQMKKE